SERDRGSNAYRDIENADVIFTIKAAPLTGIGFGHPFLRPYPLPAITTFELEAYKSHNSVLWIWMKAGIGGFVAMMYLFCSALRSGARAMFETPEPDERVVTLTAAAYVLMYAVFAFVDMGWDARSMVMLGVAMAAIDRVSLLRRPEPPEPTPPDDPTATDDP